MSLNHLIPEIAFMDFGGLFSKLFRRKGGNPVGTILAELWRVAFRRTYYRSITQLEHDLHAYLRFYNWDRPHQGYRLQGRTPATVFLARKAI